MSTLSLGLGLGLTNTPSKGGGVIVTQTIMRETLVMRENLRMTDRG